MSSKVMTAAIALVVVIGGIGWFVNTDKSATAPVAGASGSTAATASGSANAKFFRDAAQLGINQASQSGGQCALDYVTQNGQRIESGSTASAAIKTEFYGWGIAADGASGEHFLELKSNDPHSSISYYAHLDGEKVVRQDVVDALKLPSAINSGFKVNGDFGGLKGKFQAYMLIKTVQGLSQCSLNYTVTLNG